VIIDRLGVTAGADQSLGPHLLQMLRGGALAQADKLSQFAGALFAFTELAEDHQPLFTGHHLE